MKSFRGAIGATCFLAGLALLPRSGAAVTATLVGDAFTVSTSPNANKGKAGTLDVAGLSGTIKKAYVKFDLGTLPPGVTAVTC